MSKEIIKLEVREYDLVPVLNMLFENEYRYINVRKRDVRAVYQIEAHIGEEIEK